MKQQLLLCALLISINSQCADKESTLSLTLKELEAIRYITHELTAQIATEVEKDDQKWVSAEKNEINPGYKSEQGLFLLVDLTYFSLQTPLGIKRLGYVSSESNGLDREKNIFEKFRKHLTLEFVKNVGECKKSSYSYDWEEMRFSVDTFSNKITRKELDEYRGSDKLILSSHSGYDSVYKILAVGDIVLSEPKKLEEASHKDA